MASLESGIGKVLHSVESNVSEALKEILAHQTGNSAGGGDSGSKGGGGASSGNPLSDLAKVFENISDPFKTA